MPPYEYPEWALHSVYLDKITPDFFKISAEGFEKPCVRVMDLIPNVLEIPEAFVEMTAADGELKADPEQDLAKIFDIYRHTPEYAVTGSHGIGFIRGTGMRANCAYASTVAHDCHNLMVVGTSDEAMAMAANALIECEGGIAVVVDGKLEAVMELPLAGLMTLESAEVAAARVLRIEEAIAG